MFVDTFLELIKAGVMKREVDGALLHAAFFVGPKAFYRALREMDGAQLSPAADNVLLRAALTQRTNVGNHG